MEAHAVWRKLILVLVVIPLGVVLIALAVVNRKPAAAHARSSRRAPSRAFRSRRRCSCCCSARSRSGWWSAGIATWLGQGKWRRLAREETRQARDWRRQADRLEKELEGLSTGPQRAQLPAE